MKNKKSNKYKLIIFLFIIYFPHFCKNIKLLLIPYILSHQYKAIEEYLKTCSFEGNFKYLKATKSDFPKISIITPVFNTGKFALRLLRSIQYQNFNSIEIILIDDCSIDNSLELLKKYQAEDYRIRIIKNKYNKGTFASRNIGILKSKGIYLIFPDSDDILLENSLKYFYNFSIKYDYELLRYNLYEGQGRTVLDFIIKKLESRPIYQPELATYLFYGFGYLAQIDFNVSSKFVKREALIRALNVIPKADLFLYMSTFEDGLLNYFLYRTAKSSYFLKRFGYYYIKNNVIKPEYKKGYLHSNTKNIFTYITYVFNYSKNTKYEKDMSNRLFEEHIYAKGIKSLIPFINNQPNFFINIINILNANEFFAYKNYLIITIFIILIFDIFKPFDLLKIILSI